jgi:hypothetical protein
VYALAKLGELLQVMPKATGTRGQKLPAGPGRGNKTGGAKAEPPVSVVPTYADLGLDKKTAAVAKLGELLQVMPKASGTRGQLKGDVVGGTKLAPPTRTDVATYADLGLDKHHVGAASRHALRGRREGQVQIRFARESRMITGPCSPSW